MTDQAQVLESLKALFTSKGIVTVALIDDAYYSTPTTAFFTGQRLAVLRTSVTGWIDPIPEFEALALQIGSDDDISDSLIFSLWGLRAKSPEIDSWFSDFEQVQREKRALLEPLIKLFEANLGCKVLKLSPGDQLDPAKLPQLIFIDYYLDLSDRAEDSLALAEAVGDRITANFPKSNKPLVVLMSSKGSITTLMKTQFREKAGLLGGMFYFIPKSELPSRSKLALKLAVLVTALDEGRTIEKFIQALDTDIHAATEKFTRKIKGLTVEDYAYMQRLSLQGEGMPLGDYLLWLFGNYFGALLFKSVPSERAALDLMRFKVIPESDSSPSSEFVDLYRSIVAEDVPELGPHPHAIKQDGSTDVDTLPNPHFGDLFVHENDKDVLMIITPECDLMYAPDANADRPPDPTQSVLMIPGELKDASSRTEEEEVSTNFVPFKEKTHKISWRVKGIEIKSFGELAQYISNRKFKRSIRLRHPFSTEVQHLFLQDFSRIGIPVAPPSLRTIEVEICYTDQNKEIQRIPVEHPSAILYADREGLEHVHLKLPSAAKIVEIAESLIGSLEKQIAAQERDTNDKKRLVSHKERIEKFLNSLEAQIRLRQAVRVARGQQHGIAECPVEILRDASKLDSRLRSTPLVVLVKEEVSMASVPETASPKTADASEANKAPAHGSSALIAAEPGETSTA